MMACGRNYKITIPAKAGTHLSAAGMVEKWVPAFAGKRLIGVSP
jgi:hypothetical protein